MVPSLSSVHTWQAVAVPNIEFHTGTPVLSTAQVERAGSLGSALRDHQVAPRARESRAPLEAAGSPGQPRRALGCG